MQTSLVILNQNQGAFLGGAIDSALAQDGSEIEVIVVDQGSTDRSRDVMTYYGSRIRAIYLGDVGQSAGINAGLVASRGEFVCFLAADDMLKPARISTELNALLNHPSAGWSYHQSSAVDMSGRPLHPPLHPLLFKPQILKQFDLRQSSLHQAPLPFSGISGALYRRSLLQRLLPMPESPRLNHLYLYYASCEIAPGLALSAVLHESRIYGGRLSNREKKRLNAKAYLFTAYWLRVRFPERCRDTDKLFAIGLGLYYKTGGFEAEDLELVKKYWRERSQAEQFRIRAIALYYAFIS
ncbi:MAG: glycosyltransferase [Leptolyngbya sp. Prado105]|nr:glycosyltransferase [Leptolyngbya sp. Prado105]